MSNSILEFLTVFVLAAFVGFEVISKVPSILHTPLMSGSNAIHGVILVGSMLVLGSAHTGPEQVLGFLAVILATLNVVGGFVVTDRMLEMFKGRARPGAPGGGGGGAGGKGAGAGATGGGAGAGAAATAPGSGSGPGPGAAAGSSSGSGSGGDRAGGDGSSGPTAGAGGDGAST